MNQSQEPNEKPKYQNIKGMESKGKKKKIKTLFSRKELYNCFMPKGMPALNKINKTKGFL